MNTSDDPVFSFDEADHLTRIHLRLGLEDIGFVVGEQAETIHIVARDAPPPILPLCTDANDALGPGRVPQSSTGRRDEDTDPAVSPGSPRRR